MKAFIGTAGWSIPAPYSSIFRQVGSHLERYAAVMNAVEINSSFHRPHRLKTYERWSAAVPKGFRFSVKLPKTITHELRLKGCGENIARFFAESAGLGPKLSVVLVQLPPSLQYDARTTSSFFRTLHRHTDALIACEPRHNSWFTPPAETALTGMKIARVAADPARSASGGTPGGWQGFHYWRLHGNPKLYYSDYDLSTLENLAPAMECGDWCIFDNTMSGAALGDAVTLKRLVSR